MNEPTTPLDVDEIRMLRIKAELGKVLGRNIERAGAGWALVFSLMLVAARPTDSVYTLMRDAAPIEVWGWVVGVISAARVVTLIVNGWWPITLQVRISFCVATLTLVWGVLTMSYALDAVGGFGYAGGHLMPGAVLAPFAATVELLCFLALRTRLAVIKGACVDRDSNRGDHRRSGQSAAGVRECVGQEDQR
jgi:hypothetical protein